MNDGHRNTTVVDEPNDAQNGQTVPKVKCCACEVCICGEGNCKCGTGEVNCDPCKDFVESMKNK